MANQKTQEAQTIGGDFPTVDSLIVHLFSYLTLTASIYFQSPTHSACIRGSLSVEMETNLAATTAARKERLIALRKRKEASEQGNGANGGPYVHCLISSTSASPRWLHRSYDG
jgi:hypothetical protein